MPKFCGKCGSPLNENGLCPNCTPASAPAPSVESINTQPAAPAADQAYTQPAAPYPVPNAAPVEKPKSKLKIIIPVIAGAAVIVGALAACAFIFHWFGIGKSGGDGSGYASSQHKVFVTTSYGSYAGAVNTKYDEVDMLDESQRNRMLMFNDDEGRLNKFYAFRMAQDGDTFYGSYQDQLYPLIKLTVKDDHTAERSEWVSEEKMKNSILKNSEDRGAGFVRTLDLFQADGDYIYASIAGTPEFFMTQKEFNYRIIRIRKDNGDIEYVGDENTRAAEFVVSDGWIYYVDNGYMLKDNFIEYDEDRVGIYKMKTDGSEKTLLEDDFNGGEEALREGNGNAGQLSVRDGKLYFLDLSGSAGNGATPLCRMNLDGSDVETLSKQSVYNYTLDGNTAYFVTGHYPGQGMDRDSVYSLDLNSKTETPLAVEKCMGAPHSMRVIDGKLYMFFNGSGNILCSRLDLSTGQCQSLNNEIESGREEDDMGFAKPTVTKNSLVWKDSDYLK